MKARRLLPALSAMIADPLRRRKGTAFVSLLLNACYIVYLTAVAAAHSSAWYGTLAGYYISVWLIRGGISFATHRAEKNEQDPVRLARKNTLNFLFVGCALPLLGGVMAAAVIQMAIGSYPDSTGVSNIVINAIFAAVKLTSALVQFVRARTVCPRPPAAHPVARAMRILGMISALMSLLSLAVSIVAVCANGYTMWELICSFGGAVCGATLASGAYMIALSAKEWTRKTYFSFSGWQPRREGIYSNVKLKRSKKPRSI